MHQRRHRPCLQRRAEVIWWAADRLRALGGLDGSYAIAIDSVGSAYVGGVTGASNFPVTPGTFQTTSGGSDDGWVAKPNPTGSGLIYSTYLGGSGEDNVNGIAGDSAGFAYVRGFTRSTNFPTTPGAFQTSYGGGPSDDFVAN
jgi:hypothetical protein